jgi:hypothetical protein
MKAYFLVQTRFGDSLEVIAELHDHRSEFFIQGRPMYGWYDAIVELEIPNADKLNEIKEELKQSQPDILHIEAVIERTEACQAPRYGQVGQR